ncbi:MAG: M1 family aminopeptidase [bacterium]
MKLLPLFVLLFVVPASAGSVGWAPESPRCRLLGDEALLDARDPLANLRSRQEAGNALRGVFDGCPHDFDVLHYDLNFSSLNIDTQTIAGNTVVTFESTIDGLASIDLDLMSPLVVASVSGPGGVPLAFTHASDVLSITLATPIDTGMTSTVDVAYSGTPWNEGGGGFGGFWFGFPRTAYSMGVGLDADPPSMGRTWFPCYDRPCDKATVSLVATAPLSDFVVSNGLLASVDTTGTEHTFQWDHAFPISTYLIAVAQASYRQLSTSVVTDPRISVWFHPGYRTKAEVSFQNVDLMMEAFEARYGTYPFDKFAYMTTNKGDMEHQTCVSHALSLVDGTNNYDDILSHEMAHQWFGDCVTYGDWRDVWLSEGFATYSEAVYREYALGSAAYHSYMTLLMNQVLNSGQTDGVYDPTQKWGVVAYEKGGSVLHMLRGALDNDALFWQVLADYRQNHLYGNAVTTDFLDGVDATVGQDMGWFLDPWVYGDGSPVYDYSWGSVDLGGGQWRVDVAISQVQTTGTLFDVPLDFRVQTVGGDFDFNERVAAASESFSFVVTAAPTGLEIDPDDWVLDVHQLGTTSADFGPDVAAAQSLALLPPRPNPASSRAEIRFYVPSAGPVAVELFDVAGRRIRTLVDGVEQAGPKTTWWDRRDAAGARVASGVYWVRLRAGHETRSERVVFVD